MARLTLLLLIHIMGDYFLQGNKVNGQKAIKLVFLCKHVGIYTALFIAISPFVLGLTFLQGLAFSLINGSMHFVIDYYSSKFKIKYYEMNESKYNVTVVLNHSLHLIILIVTYLYIFPNAINAEYLIT